VRSGRLTPETDRETAHGFRYSLTSLAEAFAPDFDRQVAHWLGDIFARLVEGFAGAKHGDRFNEKV
jgi:ubiquinone biosynthesis protein UbiJ